MVPVRTCLGCRSRVEASVLKRIVVRGGEVVVDSSATLPGRGAWIHATVGCVELAAKRRAFGRAFRVSTTLDTSQVLATVVLFQETSAGDHIGFLPGSLNEQAD